MGLPSFDRTMKALSLFSLAIGLIKASAFDVTLSWDPPVSLAGISDYRLQDVFRNVSGAIATNSASVSTNQTAITVKNLLPGTHDFTLYSRNQLGDEAPSNTVNIPASPTGATVANLVILSHTNTPPMFDLWLGWDAPSDWQAATGLRLEVILKAWPSGIVTTNGNFAVASTNQRTLFLSGLGKGIYDFRMIATNQFGEGPPSNIARVWGSLPLAASNLHSMNLSIP